LEALKSERSTLSEKSQNAGVESDSLQRKLKALEGRYQKELEEKARLQNETRQLTDRVSELEDTNHKMLQDISSTTGRLAAKDQDLERVKAAESKLVEQLKASLEKERENRRELAERNRVQEAEARTLQRNLAEAEAQKQRAEQQAAKQVETFNKQLNDERTLKSKLEEAIKKLKEKSAAQQEQLSQLNQKLADKSKSLASEKGETNKYIAQLKQQLREEHDERKALFEEHKTLKTHANQLEASVTTLTRDLDDTKGQLRKLQATSTQADDAAQSTIANLQGSR
jgi:chromosome segregation ATPase